MLMMGASPVAKNGAEHSHSKRKHEKIVQKNIRKASCYHGEHG